MRSVAHFLKKSVVGVTVAASMATVGTIVAVSTAMATTTMVATGNVNLRSGPGTSYSILTFVPAGATVTATGTVSGGWTQIIYNGRTGYSYSTYLRTTSTTTSTTTGTPVATGTATATSNVNVRSGPGTSYSIVGVASQGQTVELTGRTSGGWSQVIWSGTARWISTTYLRTGTVADPYNVTKPTITGQVRTTANVNMRTGGYGDSPIYKVLAANTIVDVTGQTTASYTQIFYDGRLLWIYTAYTAPVTSAPSAPTTAAPNERLQKVVDYARAQIGDAYVWAAEGPDAFDCSGLTMMAYRQAGISLPHYSGSQATMGTPVTRANMQPGDLIFWYTPVRHVSIYVGNGKMVHARGTAYGVVEQSVDQYASWTPIVGIRRFITS